MGVIAAFSLNHFKHITCGSGGMVATAYYRLRYRASLLLDKCYQREEGIRNPFFLAPNYQMTELQGAVALAQIAKVRQVVERRRQLGSCSGHLEDVPAKSISGLLPATGTPISCSCSASISTSWTPPPWSFRLRSKPRECPIRDDHRSASRLPLRHLPAALGVSRHGVALRHPAPQHPRRRLPGGRSGVPSVDLSAGVGTLLRCGYGRSSTGDRQGGAPLRAQ